MSRWLRSTPTCVRRWSCNYKNFREFRRPTLLVTHNMEEAYRLGEQLLVLARGKVAAFGAKEEIFPAAADGRGGSADRMQKYFAGAE